MPGTNGVHVEHDALHTQATRLAQAKNDLEAKLTEVQGQIQDLIANGFVTQSASQSFGEAHDRWNTAAKNTISELETMGQYLGKASEAFKDVDTQFTVKI